MTRTGLRLSLATIALAIVAACSASHHGSPRVDSLMPATGAVGTDVAIAGAGFGSAQGASTVTFGGVPATVVSWTPTLLHVTVPDVLPGARSVRVTVGGRSSAAASFAVVLPSRLYVMNAIAAGSVSVYDVSNPAAVTPIAGSPFSTGASGAIVGGPGSNEPMALDTATRRLFVSNTGSIAVFDVNGASGALTPIAGSPFVLGTDGLLGLSLDPTGKFLFASRCYYPTLQALTLSVASDGALTQIATKSLGICPDALHVTPDGTRLFVNAEGAGVILGIDVAANGTLGAIQNLTEDVQAYSLAVSPAGRAYSPGYNQSYIAVFDENGAPVPGSSFPVSESNLAGITLDRSGAHAYLTADLTTGAVLALDVASSGAVSQSGELALKGRASGPLALSGDGTHLYAVDRYDHVVHVVSVGTSGTLTEAPGSPFAEDVPSGKPYAAIATP